MGHPVNEDVSLMKKVILSILPDFLRLRLRSSKAAKNWTSLWSAWESSISRCAPVPAVKSLHRIIFFPADVNLITGSLGDEAMITAAIQSFEKALGRVEVEILCSDSAVEMVRARGFVPVPLPAPGQFPSFFVQHLSRVPHDAVLILGADVLDGYYNPTTSLWRLVAADIASRCGVDVTILGASFNAKPAPQLKAAFEKLDSRVRLNIRDETSLARLRAFAKVDARLVADAAFSMTPGRIDKATGEWVSAQRADGRLVIGMNVHPMLIKNAGEADTRKIIEVATSAIRTVSEGRAISWLMLPHDYRGDRGDGRCLKPIHEALAAAGDIRTHFLEGEHRAADLKAMAGLLDGVVTGRMHLAIAALGMGVPTLSLTYQDKFEGLYRHFGLPQSLLLAPSVFDSETDLVRGLTEFVENIPQLTAIVAAKRPEVLALSERNFDLR